MSEVSTRRQFLSRVGAAAAVASLPMECLLAAGDEPKQPRARVAIGRDEKLVGGKLDEHRELLGKLLDAAVQKIMRASDAELAWRQLFKPRDRVGIKVNALGLSTQPAIVDAIVAGLRRARVPANRIIIWDRFDVELVQAGFKLNRSSRGARCYGTDADRIGSGYQREIEVSGRIGSCFSRIVAEQVDALISVPVLKDHNLAGVSLGMKNFYGAIHNPNKYHEDNCDPFIADVVSHRHIARKLRLTVCDGLRAQYHAGPGVHPGFAWPLGGLIVSTDVVAADAVGADLLEKQRREKGLNSFAEEKRPARHIATAGARGLGVADLDRIQRIEV